MATTSPRGRGRPAVRRPRAAAARRSAARRRRRALRGAAQLRLRIGFVFIAMVLSFFGARLVQLQGVEPGRVRRRWRPSEGGTVTVELPGRARRRSSTATASRWPTPSTA